MMGRVVAVLCTLALLSANAGASKLRSREPALPTRLRFPNLSPSVRSQWPERI
jgi:hypothetical protein